MLKILKLLRIYGIDVTILYLVVFHQREKDVSSQGFAF